MKNNSAYFYYKLGFKAKFDFIEGVEMVYGGIKVIELFGVFEGVGGTDGYWVIKNRLPL